MIHYSAHLWVGVNMFVMNLTRLCILEETLDLSNLLMMDIVLCSIQETIFMSDIIISDIINFMIYLLDDC